MKALIKKKYETAIVHRYSYQQFCRLCTGGFRPWHTMNLN